ncbi:MAG: sn-glycerol-3-phosphate ABC transporter ATP-binding protein UgpC [Abitibacteriaceae bacterium]|nr:sn-glycerol-3-phosphate ABC transporter ATP-binding protein UgpC [Abditibacteriaceae bacterium]MBV9865302.1 sn-glycerol-3-phosphate ABC transporter ATP-binding protein UgpC [Abditibacteriaceae bacterium]
MAGVELRNLNKVFTDAQTKKEVHAVKNLNLEIRDGEFLVLVGPSGCGKTTALRMIAGLEEASSGEIRIGDRLVNDVPPRDRNIAMVFQNYALYPHMSVYDNLAFGLRLRMLPNFFQQLTKMDETRKIKGEIDQRIREAAELLDINALLDRKPKALSGGQRQRVALGRAIVRHPEVFLMDEPLSNLDAKLRVQTRAELIKLHRRLGVTTVYVTHDQVEAMTMGQRIVVMKDGILQQCDTPLKLYHTPANMFVAGFLGTPSMNFIDAQVAKNGSRPLIDTGTFQVHLPEERAQALQEYVGKSVVLGIRPEDIHDKTLTPPSAVDKDNVVRANVDVIEPMGAVSIVYLTSGSQTLLASVDAETKAKEGAPLDIVIDSAAAHVFNKETEQAIV